MDECLGPAVNIKETYRNFHYVQETRLELATCKIYNINNYIQFISRNYKNYS